MKSKNLLILFGGILLLALIILGSYLLYNKLKPGISNENVSAQDKVVFTVGEEKIYQKDMDFLLNSYPPFVKDREKVAKAKLVEDSIILQAASKDNLISLGPTFYNSTSKDYTLRFTTVDNLKLKIDTNADRLQGSVITLWFMNGSVGPLGYEKSKQVANEKITKIYNEVKAGTLTMEGAAKMIRDDVSLQNIDSAYKENAYFEFDATKGTQIGFSKEFSAILWKLNKGDISVLYTASDFAPGGSKVDAAYMFGKVTNKEAKGVANFSDWLASKKKLYEVKSI